MRYIIVKSASDAEIPCPQINRGSTHAKEYDVRDNIDMIAFNGGHYLHSNK